MYLPCKGQRVGEVLHIGDINQMDGSCVYKW